MSEPLKAPTIFGRPLAPIQSDQDLAKSYFELRELRTLVRLAECGRTIPIEPNRFGHKLPRNGVGGHD
jgi:hypothetical protein